MSMNGSEYGGHLNSPAGQTLPRTEPDGRSRSVRDTPASNRRNAGIAGLVLGLIPLLSIVGLVVSIVALRGYRRAGERGTLAIVGIAVSAIVIVAVSVPLLIGALGR